jgi:hypothetical protein
LLKSLAVAVRSFCTLKSVAFGLQAIRGIRIADHLIRVLFPYAAIRQSAPSYWVCSKVVFGRIHCVGEQPQSKAVNPTSLIPFMAALASLC